MLDVQNGISVWQLRNQSHFELVQNITTPHLSRTISTTRYKNAQWLATSSAFGQNSTHLGSVHIYRSAHGSYEHIQTIQVDIPTQIEIATVHASGELVLYMLTENRIRPLIVFKYTGITLFREFFVATTLPLGRRFRLIGPTKDDDRGATELIAVIGTNRKVDIIETVLS